MIFRDFYVIILLNDLYEELLIWKSQISRSEELKIKAK